MVGPRGGAVQSRRAVTRTTTSGPAGTDPGHLSPKPVCHRLRVAAPEGWLGRPPAARRCRRGAHGRRLRRPDRETWPSQPAPGLRLGTAAATAASRRLTSSGVSPGRTAARRERDAPRNAGTPIRSPTNGSASRARPDPPHPTQQRERGVVDDVRAFAEHPVVDRGVGEEGLTEYGVAPAGDHVAAIAGDPVGLCHLTLRQLGRPVRLQCRFGKAGRASHEEPARCQPIG